MKASPTFAAIRERWIAMLADETLKEEAYQKFLSQHAGFFFSHALAGTDQLVSAKVRLGSDFTTDFVVAKSERSLGVNYTLIEIESPHTSPYTAAGAPSARLNTAVQQILNWKRWMERNREEAKRLFPSKQFIRHDDPNFSYMIVIGRRGRENEALRNQYAREVGITIRSFDYFTDALSSRAFNAFLWISRDIVPTVSAEDNNAYANPFWMAYSDPEWRRIASQGEYNESHMVAVNLDLLMRYRSYNADAQRDFEAFLATLPADEKEIPEHQFEWLEFT
ncbi:MAG TPA: Shedu anti-phage system protein SduA domain-containing protein [Longimicrobium sp.]